MVPLVLQYGDTREVAKTGMCIQRLTTLRNFHSCSLPSVRRPLALAQLWWHLAAQSYW